MFNKVLLIQPPSSSYLGALRLPTGLGYLSQALLENQIDHRIIDLRLRRNLSTLQSEIKSFQPDLIGLSIVSLGYKRTYELIRHIHEYYPRASFIVGGAHVFAWKESVLEECREIDFGVIQEGEQVIVELCKGKISPNNIPGLLYWDNGTVFSGTEPKLITDLDSVSFPRYGQFDLKRYISEIPLITSRGCPYRCIFCPNSLMAKKFRVRSAENVVDEIEYWYSRGIKQFVIDDDCFTLLKERVYAICDDIERRGMRDLFIRCANGIRADKSDRDLLARMRDIGVKEVGFGGDGGNNHVLMDIVHKGETLEMIEQAIQDAIAVGLEVRLFIVIGHPGETISDIEDSFTLAQKYPLIRLHLNNPIPYPGTELFEIVRSHNYFLRPPEDYLNNLTDSDNEPVFETPELPVDVRRTFLKRARRIERRVWHQATERTLENLPIIGTIAGWFLASNLGQWLFFNNVFMHSLIDKIRYRKMVRAKQ